MFLPSTPLPGTAPRLSPPPEGGGQLHPNAWNNKRHRLSEMRLCRNITGANRGWEMNDVESP